MYKNLRSVRAVRDAEQVIETPLMATRTLLLILIRTALLSAPPTVFLGILGYAQLLGHLP